MTAMCWCSPSSARGCGGGGDALPVSEGHYLKHFGPQEHIGQGFRGISVHFQRLFFYDLSGSLTLILYHEPKRAVIITQLISFLVYRNCWCEKRKHLKIPAEKLCHSWGTKLWCSLIDHPSWTNDLPRKTSEIGEPSLLRLAASFS